VIRGTLTTHLYLPSTIGERYHHYRYTPDLEVELKALGSVRLAQVDTIAYPTGSIYEMSDETVHEARTAAGTVTIIARDEPIKDFADVFSRTPIDDLGQKASPLSDGRVHELLVELQAIL